MLVRISAERGAAAARWLSQRGTSNRHRNLAAAYLSLAAIPGEVTMRFPLIRKTMSSLAVVLSVGGSAVAADMPTKAPLAPAPAIPGWTFSLTPYFWALSLNGST